jgi:hypothetical protein
MYLQPYDPTDPASGWHNTSTTPNGYIPPPPPTSKPRVWLILLACLLSFLAGSGMTYALLKEQALIWHAFGLLQQETPGALSPLLPTPTPDPQAMLSSTDFSVFIKGFATEMANKDYAVIQHVTDTQNFQSLILYTDDGLGTWEQTDEQLTTGNLGLIVQYPPISADQEGYACVGYGSHGLSQFNININAAHVVYVVGTATGPDVTGSTQATPDTMVFIFEFPQGPPGTTWLWRGYVLNNITGCNGAL